LLIEATDWLSADEIDAYNSDLVMAIAEVIVGYAILTKKHLGLPEILFGVNPKTLEKLQEKGWVPLPSCLRQTHRRGRRWGPGGGSKEQALLGGGGGGAKVSESSNCSKF
jgi:hypothetical protein